MLDNLKCELEELDKKIEPNRLINYDDICLLMKSIEVPVERPFQKKDKNVSREEEVFQNIEFYFRKVKDYFIETILFHDEYSRTCIEEKRNMAIDQSSYKNNEVSPFYFLTLQANRIKKDDPEHQALTKYWEHWSKALKTTDSRGWTKMDFGKQLDPNVKMTTTPSQDREKRAEQYETLMKNKRENPEPKVEVIRRKPSVSLSRSSVSFWNKLSSKGRTLQEKSEPILTTPLQDREKIAKACEARMRKN